jgi:hypothetical protein
MFVNDSINYAANNPLTMVLITDGQPYPSQYNPCNAPNQKNELDYNGIETHIVGSGNFNANVLACLVDDASTQIHGIADSNSIDFQQGFVLGICRCRYCGGAPPDLINEINERRAGSRSRPPVYRQGFRTNSLPERQSRAGGKSFQGYFLNSAQMLPICSFRGKLLR